MSRDTDFKMKEDALNARYKSGQRNVVFDPVDKKGPFAPGRNAMKRWDRTLRHAQRALQVLDYAIDGLGRAPKLKRYLVAP